MKESNNIPKDEHVTLPWSDPYVEDVHVCATTKVLSKYIEKNPNFKEDYIAQELKTRDRIKEKRNSPFSSHPVYEIKVYYHVIVDSAQQATLDPSILQGQIDVLNADFRNTHGNDPARWASKNIDTQIQFSWSAADINRVTTSEIFLADDSMKYAATGGSDVHNPTAFLNIWVCLIDGGILGYAQFPGGLPASDGIVISASSLPGLGSGGAPYNLGRTATHEVGHYLNLFHIWGDGNCEVDDLVSDTPVSGMYNIGCPQESKDTCPNLADPDMWENYMDYTDDACMNMFTSGQSGRMRDCLVNQRSGIFSAVTSGTTTTTTTATPSSTASLDYVQQSGFLSNCIGVYSNDNFVYAVDSGAGTDGGLYVFSKDAQGFLTELHQIPYSTKTFLGIWGKKNSGNDIYVANGLDGIQIYTVDANGLLTAGGSSSVSGATMALNLFQDDNYLYAAEDLFGLGVYDSNLNFVTRFAPTGSHAYGVWSSGTYVYLANGYNGIDVYSIDSTTNTFTNTSTYVDVNNEAILDVWGDGNFIYSANMSGGINVYSTSSGTLTLLANHIENAQSGSAHYAYEIWSKGAYLFVANYAGGLLAYGVNQNNGSLNLLASDSAHYADPNNGASWPAVDVLGDSSDFVYTAAVGGGIIVHKWNDGASQGATTTTTAAPTTPAPTTVTSCIEEDGIYCLTSSDERCDKRVSAEVRIISIVNDFINIEPLCDVSVLNSVVNGDKVTICKGGCPGGTGELYVSKVNPVCALNGDFWIKVDEEGSITNFYKKQSGLWDEKDSNVPCPVTTTTPLPTTTAAPTTTTPAPELRISITKPDFPTYNSLGNVPELKVSVVDVNNAHDHWAWRIDTPFPASGAAGGNQVLSGNTATITELTKGTHTIYVALVDSSNTLLSATSNYKTAGVQVIVAPTIFVEGNVPNWNQPKFYERTSVNTTGPITGLYISESSVGNSDGFYAWSSPASAASQLGHLNTQGNLALPDKSYGHLHGIDDKIDGGILGQDSIGIDGTIKWNESSTKGGGHGWGDYLIDGPIWRPQVNQIPSFYSINPATVGACELTDFGWFMNTSNSSEDVTQPSPAGTRIGDGLIEDESDLGTSVMGAYRGLKDFYRVAGYDNVIGMVFHMGALHPATSYPSNVELPLEVPEQPQGILPRHWIDNSLDGMLDGNYMIAGVNPAITWETIRTEIDDGRTVIAHMQGWSIQPIAPVVMPANFPNTTHTLEKQTTSAAIGDGIGYYHINDEVTVDYDNGEIYTQMIAATPYWSGKAKGHAVLIIGYIPSGAADDISNSGNTDWIIVRDNSENTERNVIIPFQSGNINPTGNVDTTRWGADIIMSTYYTDISQATTNLSDCYGNVCNQNFCPENAENRSQYVVDLSGGSGAYTYPIGSSVLKFCDTPSTQTQIQTTWKEKDCIYLKVDSGSYAGTYYHTILSITEGSGCPSTISIYPALTIPVDVTDQLSWYLCNSCSSCSGGWNPYPTTTTAEPTTTTTAKPVGRIAYIANGRAGVQTYSVSEAGGITPVDSDDTGITSSSGALANNFAEATAVWGDKDITNGQNNFIYVTYESNGLHVYSDDGVGNLTHKSSHVGGGSACGVWGDGSFVYVANGCFNCIDPSVPTTGDSRIEVYSVDDNGILTNVSTASLQGTFPNASVGAEEGFRNITGDGTYIYATLKGGDNSAVVDPDAYSGLYVYSVDNAGSLTFKTMSALSDEQGADGVWSDGQYIYMGNNSGLHAFVFDGVSLILKDSIKTSRTRNVKKIWGDENYIYACTGYVADDSAVNIFSFDGTSFAHVGADQTALENSTGAHHTAGFLPSHYDVWGDGDFIYVANGEEGLHVFSDVIVAPTNTLTRLGSHRFAASAYGSQLERGLGIWVEPKLPPRLPETVCQDNCSLTTVCYDYYNQPFYCSEVDCAAGNNGTKIIGSGDDGKTMMGDKVLKHTAVSTGTMTLEFRVRDCTPRTGIVTDVIIRVNGIINQTITGPTLTRGYCYLSHVGNSTSISVNAGDVITAETASLTGTYSYWSYYFMYESKVRECSAAPSATTTTTTTTTLAPGATTTTTTTTTTAAPASQTISFYAAASSIQEGDTGTQTHNVIVTRSSGGGTATVVYATSDVTATASDYVTGGNGTVSWASGETSKNISITIYGDTTIESDETFNVTLSSPTYSGGSSSITGTNPHVVTIVNDDVATTTTTTTTPAPSISIVHPSLGTYNTISEVTLTDLTVAIVGNAHHHWHWRLGTSFPASGSAGGTMVTTPGDLTDAITGLTLGTHTISVALVDSAHNVLSPSITASHEFIVGPTRFVDGDVPNWMQPYFYETIVSPPPISNYVIANSPKFEAWCSPTTAACQLGHLNTFHGLTLPAKSGGHNHGISDLVDAGPMPTPDTGLVGTKTWDSEHGWGDHLLDGPTQRASTNAMYGWYPYVAATVGACELTDLGWFMNTNNSSENSLPVVPGTRSGNGIIDVQGSGGIGGGTYIHNIYLGLKDFYRVAGYGFGVLGNGVPYGMTGIVYHRPSDGTVSSYPSNTIIPFALPEQPHGIYPRHWINQNLFNNKVTVNNTDYIITGTDPQMMWDTIKLEIDESRTVIACLQGWDLQLSSAPYHSTFPNTIHVAEKVQLGQAAPEGIEYWHLKASANVHPNPNHLQPLSAADSTDPPHWGGTALGHTTLIIGYIPAGAADDVSTNKDTNWLIVRDNDETTNRNVIVPFSSGTSSPGANVDTTRWLKDMIMATLYTDPSQAQPALPDCTAPPRLME